MHRQHEGYTGQVFFTAGLARKEWGGEGWQREWVWVGVRARSRVRTHKSSTTALPFNTLFPFELSVKPLIN